MPLDRLRTQIQADKLRDEHDLVAELLHEKCLDQHQHRHVIKSSQNLVESCRNDSSGKSALDSFLLEFGLSNKEGVALMCLAEALLRVPDAKTADRLIAEKIQSGDWGSHAGQSESLFVNASTWGLILTGHIVQLDPKITAQPGHWLKRLTTTLGEPIIRKAMLQAMRIMGGQYVLGRNMDEGINRGQQDNSTEARFSFDMLGEAARTEKDADRYYESYFNAINRIGSLNRNATENNDVYEANGISVKLSALHPKYHFAHQQTVMDELLPRITELCLQAKKYNIGLSIDAEEAARLDLSLDIFENLARNSKLADWHGLGFVLQTYQKRAPLVAKWLVELARETNRRLMTRLVKGAYWDTEIKQAQQHGLKDYPVFTRKANTDICYLSCAKILLSAPAQIFPQFATHNAYTALAVLEMAADKEFEFQRLHGMGKLLYQHLRKKIAYRKIPLRVYAPIGKHQDLLPYLVRRLLENGANSSFVNRFLDKKMPVNKLIQDPYELATEVYPYSHASIPNPKHLFKFNNEERSNSLGIDLDSQLDVDLLHGEIAKVHNKKHTAGPIINGIFMNKLNRTGDILNPSNTKKPLGISTEVTDDTIELALASAHSEQTKWQGVSAQDRGNRLNHMAYLLETNMQTLIGIIVLEAGRTIPDAVSEVREAVDFCRYYALQAEKNLGQNSGLTACGTFFCISPWNFPLAIFVGQIAAALAAGNAVIAKPAEHTPLIACRAVKLFHQAGVPTEVLHLLLGNGAEIGNKLLSDPRINGVCFTGSTEVAQQINQQLAQRPGPPVPLIAETGGQNCMIVDSTALPEQVVDDVISSAFLSAGQRCSALRVLFLQENIADKVIDMLKGAMQSIVVGNPSMLSTDVGPVIDQSALNMLKAHAQKMSSQCKDSALVPINAELSCGTFFAPRMFEIDSLDQLKREVFGPILHIIRYSANELDQVIDQINHTGYGLTLGIHSRIEAYADYVFRKTNVGNTYINRDMVGAVVGVNPFGGNGLSGTGPKAGGPNYLYRFCKPIDETLQSGKKALATHVESTPLHPTLHRLLADAVQAQQALSQISVEQRTRLIKGLALNDIVREKLNAEGLSHENLSNYLNTLCKVSIERFSNPVILTSPTGEENSLHYQGRGVVLCVMTDDDSPEQIVAQLSLVLAAGCSAIFIGNELARSQTKPLFDAFFRQQLLANTVQILGKESLYAVASDTRICAVTAISGTHNLCIIKKLIAERKGAIIPFIEMPATMHSRYSHTIYWAITYLIIEKTRTENLVARGGNTQLFNL